MKITKEKIIEHIKWDYGIDIREIPYSKSYKTMVNIFAVLTIIIGGAGLGGILCLFLFAYPFHLLTLLLIDFIILLYTYGITTGKMKSKFIEIED